MTVVWNMSRIVTNATRYMMLASNGWRKKNGGRRTMIAIPDMSKPKNCAECFRILKCKAVPRWVTADDSIPKSCPLIDIVTCGECKWSYIDEKYEGTLWCKVHFHHYRVNSDGFCNYGERRKDGI